MNIRVKHTRKRRAPSKPQQRYQSWKEFVAARRESLPKPQVAATA